MCARMVWLSGRVLLLAVITLNLNQIGAPSAFGDEPSAKTREATAAVSRARVFSIEILDEGRAPLADVAVAVYTVVPSPTLSVQERMELTTQADGRAAVDLSADGEPPPLSSLRVLAWKPGYQLASRSLPMTEPLILLPQQVQTFRLSGVDSQPLVKALLSFESVDRLPIPGSWAHTFRVQSDRYGICKLPLPAMNATARLKIAPEAGASQLFEFRGSMSMSDGRLDQRDTVFVRLVATGAITGRVPTQFASGYRIRLTQSGIYSAARGPTPVNRTTVTEPDEAGNFEFRDLVVGRYLLRAERIAEGDQSNAALENHGTLLTFAPVMVEPAKTAIVPPEVQTVTTVLGRLVSDQTNPDYSGVKVSVLSVEQAPDESFPRYSGSFPQLSCDTQGEFVCALTPGNYRFSVATAERWAAVESAYLTIGPGAAMLRVPDLRVTQLRKVNVRITDESWKELEAADSRAVSVMAKYSRKISATELLSLGALQRTAVQAYVPVELEPTQLNAIHRSLVGLTTRMVDLDPTPDFELAIDHEASGIEKNVALRVRVVDSHKVPLSQVPVRIVARSQPLPPPGTSSTSIASAQILDFGSQMRTDTNGWLVLPPVQLFGRPYIGARNSSNANGVAAILQAQTVGGEGYSHTGRSLFSDEDGLNLPDVIQLDDIVLDPVPAARSVVGRLLSSSGAPLAGRVVWLARAPGILRAITDENGGFHFDRIDKDAWLLSDVNWTITKVADLPDGFQLREGDLPETEVVAPRGRMSLEERRRLAAALLEKILKDKDNAGQIPNQIPNLSGAGDLPAEAYLDPDKYFDQLAVGRFGDRALDAHRLAFLIFWTDLGEEKVRRLAESAAVPLTRARILKILADRLLDPKIYEEAMEAIEFEQLSTPQLGRLLRGGQVPRIPQPPRVPLPNFLYESSTDVLVSDLAVELFRRDMLEPHLGKVKAVVERYEQSQARRNATFSERYEPSQVTRCRALLNPSQFLDSLEEIGSGQEPESRLRYYRARETAALLYPGKMFHSHTTLSSLPTLWSFWGQTDPLAAMQRLFGPFSAEEWAGEVPVRSGRQAMAFVVCNSALLTGHGDAVAASQELCRAIRELELHPNRMTAAQADASVGTWCATVAKRHPELSRQMNWHAVLYQFTKEESLLNERGPTFSVAEDADPIKTALCVASQWPELASDLVKREKRSFQREMECQRIIGAPSRTNYATSIALLACLDPEWVGAIIDDMAAEGERIAGAGGANAAGNSNSSAAQAWSRLIASSRLAIVYGLLRSENETLSQ